MRRSTRWRRWTVSTAGLALGLAMVVAGGLLSPAAADNAGRTAVSAAADPPVLVMSSSVSPTTLTVGSPATYTVTVQNTGTAAATPVTTTLPFTPTGTLTFGALPAGCTADVPTQTVTCTAASIPAGGSVSYQIPVTVLPSVSDGTNISLRAITSAPGAQAGSTTLISQAFTQVDVAITKTAPATVAPGGTITWTITVVNNGPSNAATVTWHDSTDGNLTTITSFPCGDTGLTVSCSIGTMTPGETRTYTITATVNPSLANGTVIPDCAVVYTGTSPETNWDNNTSCADTTVGPVTPPTSDVDVSKTGPATVEVGGIITYTVTVTNHGPSPAANVVVRDPISVAFESISALPPDCTLQDTTVVCQPTTLAVNESRTYTFSVKLASSVTAGTSIPNCATVTSTTIRILRRSTLSCVGTDVVPVPTAAVRIVKTATGVASPGGPIRYRLTVANDGPDAAASVVVSNPVDPLVTVTSVPSGCSVTSGTVACAVGTLAAGDTRVFDITGTVSPGAADLVIHNCASVSSSTGNPNPLDTTSCADTYVDPPAPVADVLVTKKGPAVTHAGDTFDYTVSATNHGPDTATNLVITDPLPVDQVTVTALPAGCTVSADTVNCTVGTLAVGATASFTFTVQVDPSLAAGTEIDNCAHATSVSTILNPFEQPSCTQTIVVAAASADLAMAKTAPASVAPGGAIGYTLTATNNGPSTAVNAVVTDYFDPALVTITALPPACSSANGVVTCAAGTLAAGGSVGFPITVTVNPGIQGLAIVNCAHASSATFDSGVSNNQACAATSVGAIGPVINVDLVKSGPLAVSAGGTASYTFVVTNHGPGSAGNVTVTDVLPAELGTVTALPADCVANGAVIGCSTGPLAVGASRSFTFTVRVNSGVTVGTVITDCASVGSVSSTLRGAGEGPANCTQAIVVPDPTSHLSVTKTAARRALPGGTLRYTEVASNLGPDPARNVTVLDPVDTSQVTVVSLPSVCTLQGSTIVCVVGTLAAGSSYPLDIVVRVNRNTAGQVIRDCAVAYTPTRSLSAGQQQSCDRAAQRGTHGQRRDRAERRRGRAPGPSRLLHQRAGAGAVPAGDRVIMVRYGGARTRSGDGLNWFY